MDLPTGICNSDDDTATHGIEEPSELGDFVVCQEDIVGKSWGILFSHPAGYSPVCTTELGKVNKLTAEFNKRGVKPIALSCDPDAQHKDWIADIQDLSGSPISFPIIADERRDLAIKLGIVDSEEKDKAGLPLTARAIFIIGPDKRLKLSLRYPATTGRNFDEVLRVLDSLQLTAYKKVATPVNWRADGECMVLPSVKPEDAKTLFPGHYVQDLPSGKQYMRFTPQPK